MRHIESEWPYNVFFCVALYKNTRETYSCSSEDWYTNRALNSNLCGITPPRLTMDFTRHLVAISTINGKNSLSRSFFFLEYSRNKTRFVLPEEDLLPQASRLLIFTKPRGALGLSFSRTRTRICTHTLLFNRINIFLFMSSVYMFTSYYIFHSRWIMLAYAEIYLHVLNFVFCKGSTTKR